MFILNMFFVPVYGVDKTNYIFVVDLILLDFLPICKYTVKHL